MMNKIREENLGERILKNKKREYTKQNTKPNKKTGYNNNLENRRKEEVVQQEKMYDDQVEGRNAILELLDSNRDINKIFIQHGEKHGSIHKIIALAKEKRVVLVEVEKKKLDEMSEKGNHQGVIAIVPPFDYCEVEDILEVAKQRKEEPFILILDGIEDPHNLGAIIRTAETAGVHGVIIPKRRACSVNATVTKVSEGAVEHIKIARVNNINETIAYLKQNNIWIYGTDAAGSVSYYNQDLKGAVCLIIGSEGFGMSRLVSKNCDVLLTIPMGGKVNSLNASVSAGIIIYETKKQRDQK